LRKSLIGRASPIVAQKPQRLAANLARPGALLQFFRCQPENSAKLRADGRASARSTTFSQIPTVRGAASSCAVIE